MACVNIVRFAADAEPERKSTPETSLGLTRHAVIFQKSCAKSDVRTLVFSNVLALNDLFRPVTERLKMFFGLV